MAEQPQDQYAQTDYLSDINVKLRDIEEKQNLIRDRILLIGENLIEEKDDVDEELGKIKNNMTTLVKEISKIKLAIQRLVEDRANFSRKTELAILEKQFKMFQPLEFARISDVKDLINEALNKKQ